MSGRERPRTVLVIDDDEDFREVVQIVLGAEGYRVVCARNGDEGLRMAARSAPDLVLLDFLMPGKNGLETSRSLAADPRLAGVPVLAFTSFGNSPLDFLDPRDRSLPGNICGFLEKHIEFTDLVARVAETIATARHPQA